MDQVQSALRWSQLAFEVVYPQLFPRFLLIPSPTRPGLFIFERSTAASLLH